MNMHRNRRIHLPHQINQIRRTASSAFPGTLITQAFVTFVENGVPVEIMPSAASSAKH
ncbi:hypothetical protein QN386_16510 [Pseudomonas sp. CCI3.2]|uniref:hypothetical protein n=1 Tax=unclassified Pseudomonas TaxID=196821 RepID=UPI002AC96EF1|nr:MULTISPECIES: hypothetical protein [unclassified Pseudomonas]MEB0078441.1 hypothetical protein [Pseudomonas sp. MH10out]MEB0090153.1 hypothetical protein [Pseudomonas sp. CCI4.2]MEB0102913.1 hypothetical protein [Pseudomonas sp. CCI3.2]MEB0131776.1 hypothetical protein [Pseudomonas sp. CCI2.4]MEB0158064.1 hypothetical protein [Pseudomonas sp. AH2 (2023)]